MYKQGLFNFMVLCLDIMECTTDKPCHTDAFCTEELGSFRCTCAPGFTGDGFQCESNYELWFIFIRYLLGL